MHGFKTQAPWGQSVATPNENRCYAWNEVGHRRGDKKCPKFKKNYKKKSVASLSHALQDLPTAGQVAPTEMRIGAPRPQSLRQVGGRSLRIYSRSWRVPFLVVNRLGSRGRPVAVWGAMSVAESISMTPSPGLRLSILYATHVYWGIRCWNYFCIAFKIRILGPERETIISYWGRQVCKCLWCGWVAMFPGRGRLVVNVAVRPGNMPLLPA